MEFRDEIKVKGDNLVFFVVPVDSDNIEVFDTSIGKLRKLTFEEWKLIKDQKNDN